MEQNINITGRQQDRAGLRHNREMFIWLTIAAFFLISTWHAAFPFSNQSWRETLYSLISHCCKVQRTEEKHRKTVIHCLLWRYNGCVNTDLTLFFDENMVTKWLQIWALLWGLHKPQIETEKLTQIYISVLTFSFTVRRSCTHKHMDIHR